MEREPKLAPYRPYFDNLFRRQPHIRSAEVEEVLGLAQEPFAMIDNTVGMLVNADLLLEKRTVFEWVFEPVLEFRARLAGATG